MRSFGVPAGTFTHNVTVRNLLGPSWIAELQLGILPVGKLPPP